MSSKDEIHEIAGAKTSGHKPNYDLLTPLFLRRSAQRMTDGMHYGRENWKKGIKDKNYVLDRLNHAFEHLVKAMDEIAHDVPMTDDDLAAVAVNCMMAMEYQEVTKDTRLMGFIAIGEEADKLKAIPRISDPIIELTNASWEGLNKQYGCTNCGAAFTHAPWKMRYQHLLQAGDFFFHCESCTIEYHIKHPELKVICITYPDGRIAAPLP